MLQYQTTLYLIHAFYGIFFQKILHISHENMHENFNISGQNADIAKPTALISVNFCSSHIFF